jgi:hypothetical protein
MAGKPLLASLPSNCQSWATVAAGLRYSLVKDSELGWHAKTIALGVLLWLKEKAKGWSKPSQRSSLVKGRQTRLWTASMEDRYSADGE